ncbi:hypothetical protein G4B88_000947 [Cannabis sativa]|uniref:Ubiquitin-like protease family profile domain-containing protein n=1 Tax=Cannabis sativa TaxID=3483 RepID=A0A7J6E1S5_CANSA|nr:hypothetical protein G4B88_000947 [Cannabis sativa]
MYSPITSQESLGSLAHEGSGGLVRRSNNRSEISYKVMVLWYKEIKEERGTRVEYKAMTFCFDTREWSRWEFSLIGRKLDNENYISCNGMLYWLESDLVTTRVERIISIDPFKDPNHPKYFRYFNFPSNLDTTKGRLTVRIGVVRGRLRLSQLNLVEKNSFLLKVWEFNYDPLSSDEDDNSSSLKWSLVHQVEEVKWKASHHLSVAAFHGDNENVIFLLRNTKIVYQYDILRNVTTKIGQFSEETVVLSELVHLVLFISGSFSERGSSYMAGKRKRKGGNEPVKKDVTPEPNDNAVAWRNFFNANYKALRAAEKGLTEKEATDKLKVQYKGFTDEEKSEWRSYDPNPNPAKKAITLTSNPVILPNYYSDSEGRKSSDHFVSSINELKEYISNELKSQLRSFSLKFMDKGEGVGGIDRELEEDAAAKTGKKAECSQAVEESPLKSPVRSKTNVVGLSDENVVDSVSTPSLSVTKSVEDEGAAHKTFDDEDFDIVEVASFWNKGKALVKSKKTQSENVPLIEDDFNDKAYEQFIESGRTVVGPFKTKEAIPRNQYGFYKFIFSNTSDPGYLLAKFRKFEVDRRCMASLRPLREVEGSIIDCFSILMNKYERDSRLPDQPRVWYMPTRISQKTLGSFNVKRIAKDREWSKLFYEDNLEKCVKMFVPVLTLEGAPHWFGAEVNMKSKVVSFMDSLHTAMNEKYRVEATKEMLSTLDLLFEENRSKNVTFVDFRIDRKDRGLPQQDNDRDCGVYVMKYMDAVPNEEDVVDEFHPVEARLEIAARIITDEQNEIRRVISVLCSLDLGA